jgi:hypothetical protein
MGGTGGLLLWMTHLPCPLHALGHSAATEAMKVASKLSWNFIFRQVIDLECVIALSKKSTNHSDSGIPII